MTELIHRYNDTAADIEYVEFRLPDPAFFGSGEFRFRIRNWAPDREINPNIYSAPAFQAIASIKGETLQVLIGRMDCMAPTSGTEYRIPPDALRSDAHDFVVQFRNWEVECTLLDGTPLQELRKLVAESAPSLVPNWVKVVSEADSDASIVVLHPSPIIDEKVFSEDERKRVFTWVEFDLPFAVPYLQGALPPAARFPKDRSASVVLATRQRSALEISEAMGLPIDVASSSILICNNDRHGRVNVSRVQFRVEGWICLSERGDLFRDCLIWLNRFLEHYREVTAIYNLRRLAETDIVYYMFAHVLDDERFNRVVEPAGHYDIAHADFFPNDCTLAEQIHSRSRVGRTLWERLLLEARTAHALHDYRISVVNAITAMEGRVLPARVCELSLSRG